MVFGVSRPTDSNLTTSFDNRSIVRGFGGGTGYAQRGLSPEELKAAARRHIPTRRASSLSYNVR